PPRPGRRRTPGPPTARRGSPRGGRTPGCLVAGFGSLSSPGLPTGEGLRDLPEVPGRDACRHEPEEHPVPPALEVRPVAAKVLGREGVAHLLQPRIARGRLEPPAQDRASELLVLLPVVDRRGS